MIELKKIRENSELSKSAAAWFHSKWKVPKSEYEKSMKECTENQSCVPEWYVALEGDKIIGGVGVIENDFHERSDLTPNVCALYVNSEYRDRGIARRLLDFVWEDMKSFGVNELYLLTDHEDLYERLGWEFLFLVNCQCEEKPARMYILRERVD